MREIKFRAWNRIVGRMSDVFELHDIRLNFQWQNLDIMQYTGLKDKNGKEIYEGDIVQFIYWWFDGNEAESLLTGTIVYSNDLMSFQLKGVKNEEWEKHTGHENDTEYLTPFSELCFEEADFKVIGNIYQDSHLLDEKPEPLEQ